MRKILGLGNALTDILLQVSEEDLRELGLPKGGNFRPLNWVLGGILFLLGLFMFVRKGH